MENIMYTASMKKLNSEQLNRLKSKVFHEEEN